MAGGNFEKLKACVTLGSQLFKYCSLTKMGGKHLMNDQKTTIHDLKNIVEKFVQDRDWVQFHNAKNLSMALAAEVAELMEHFLWFEGNESDAVMQKSGKAVQQEIADIAWMLLCFCNRYNIDLAHAIEQKMEINAAKYSVAKAKGRREKYTEL